MYVRTLIFNVNGQTITLDPECDVSSLVPGAGGNIQARFNFSSEWRNCVKVAAFYSNLGREYTPQLLKNGEVCDIPPEALKKSIFKVKVLGQKKNSPPMYTNKATVHQKGGNV